MWKLFLIGGIVFLLSTVNPSVNETIEAFAPIEGGKNLAFDQVTLNEFGLPQVIHVYKIDFPLKQGDSGNVISVLQQMINARNYGFTVPITGIYDTSTRVAIMSDEVTLESFKLFALQSPPIVADVKVYDYKPGQK